MRSVTTFNDSWAFHQGFDETLIATFTPGEDVRLPHPPVVATRDDFSADELGSSLGMRWRGATAVRLGTVTRQLVAQ